MRNYAIIRQINILRKEHSSQWVYWTDSKKKEKNKENTLEQDILLASDWVVRALTVSGYQADYSLESMKEIDRFFDEQSAEDGIISKNRGQILFGIASYIGQTAIRLYGGKWITDDTDPQGEVSITVELPDGTKIWPALRCMKRLANGAEDSIYAYLYVLGNKKHDLP